jgi:hypothetical protein
MRHVVVASLVLGLGITAMTPVGFAQVNVPLQPAPLTLLTPSGSGGSAAGGHTVCPPIGPCYEPHPFDGGDRN